MQNAGLYVHVPFCSSLCPYCDFAVLVGRLERRDDYVDALVAEAKMRAPEFREWSFNTLYFGGGTPSLLTAGQLATIIDALRGRYTLQPDLMIHLEANPEAVHPQRLSEWRRQGVGFLSIGVQSFAASSLEFLGREHSAERSRRAVEQAVGCGFHTVSVDLIYGLPGQTADQWRRELAKAAALSPHHLSCYQLTVHRRSVLGVRHRHGEGAEAPERTKEELFLATHRWLREEGYPGYEVSNFAAGPEHCSAHNSKYWRHLPYLGLGPSAHSFDGRRRWWNAHRPSHWRWRLTQGRLPTAGEEVLGDEQLALETVMLGLRTADGIDLHRFEARFGFDLLHANRQLIEGGVESGLLRLRGSRLSPTDAGMAVCEALARDFVVGETDAGR